MNENFDIMEIGCFSKPVGESAEEAPTLTKCTSSNPLVGCTSSTIRFLGVLGPPTGRVVAV